MGTSPPVFSLSLTLTRIQIQWKCLFLGWKGRGLMILIPDCFPEKERKWMIGSQKPLTFQSLVNQSSFIQGPQKQNLKSRLSPQIPSSIQTGSNASGLFHSATSLPAIPLRVSSGSLTPSQGLRKTTTKITLHGMMWCIRAMTQCPGQVSVPWP